MDRPANHLLSMCVAVLLLNPVVWPAAILADDTVDEKELANLQGRWEPVSVTFDGNEVKLDNGRDFRFDLKGRVATVQFGGKVAGTTEIVHLAAGQPFGQIDFARDYAGEKSRVKMIYKIEGDTITTCASLPNGDRPRELASKPGSKTRLTVSKIARE